MLIILWVDMPLRRLLLSLGGLQPSSDLSSCERVPAGLCSMVRIAQFCIRSTWSESCLELGSQIVVQYSRCGKTCDRYSSL